MCIFICILFVHVYLSIHTQLNHSLIERLHVIKLNPTIHSQHNVRYSRQSTRRRHICDSKGKNDPMKDYYHQDKSLKHHLHKTNQFLFFGLRKFHARLIQSPAHLKCGSQAYKHNFMSIISSKHAICNIPRQEFTRSGCD